jgi:cellulose synthase/poly-beta-1,6-N-acetylglucosamine synthase-like glycosyltransferase
MVTVVSTDLVSLFFVLLTLALVLPACTNVWWMMHAWRSPAVNASIVGVPRGRHIRTSFSAIVPFRHEAEAVVRETVDRLLAQTHGDLEIVLSVGDDDHDAIVIAQNIADENPGVVAVSVDLNPVKNKPKQLNSALTKCHKDYVAVFDAESLTHPELFAHVDALAQSTRAEVLQFGVQLVNHRTTWFSLRNCLEYFFWFRSRLHLHAQHGFIPLGGNTVFIRRELLASFGGWDEKALAEDCDLGVRLSSLGVKVAVSYDPRLVTREETPDSVRALIKQRSRWNQGFLQVLAKGDWRRLPTRNQRLLARYTLLQPFLQALTLIALPLGVAAALTGGIPLPVALVTFTPLIPMTISLLFESVALAEFCRGLGLPLGVRDYLRLGLTALPYQVLMGYAALRAVLRERRGHSDWEKTPHTGNHLVPAHALEAAT